MIAQIGMAVGGVVLALLVIIPRNLTPVLAAAATHPSQALMAAFAPRPAPAQPPASAQQDSSPAAPPADARERFAVDLLRGMENTQPSAEMVAFVVEWTIAEDGGDGALARNNPLNTTMCGYNMTGAINGDGACGVQGYATYQDGIDATLATLSQSNFASVAAALRQNDAAAARQAIWDSPWAASHYNGGADWPHVEPRSAGPAPAASASTSTPIAAGGDDCDENVRVALDANGGALRHITIAPGTTWSFNAAMGNPGAIPYRTCAGVPGGNWCNLAARYAQVARRFDAQLDFIDHGADLGAGRENSVAIWNVGGQAGFANGSQDLLITNTRATPLHFGIQADGGQVAIVGWEG